jgi:putative FmdB family regulatory protein
MPHYEFLCKTCMKTFSKVLTFTEYEESKIMCPHCGSHKVEQQESPFSWDRVNLSASEEDDRARVLSDWESEGGAGGTEKQADNAAEEKPTLNHRGR